MAQPRPKSPKRQQRPHRSHPAGDIPVGNRGWGGSAPAPRPDRPPVNGAGWRIEDLISTDLPLPTTVIPHRDPFLFLTQVTEVTVGERAVGYWQLTGDEPFFAGHFPGRPTLPGVLMCESIAQLGAYALLARPDFAGRLALFGGLDGVRFRRQVLPGERLDLEVELGRVSARAGKGSGRALVGDEEACRCDLMFVFVEGD